MRNVFHLRFRRKHLDSTKRNLNASWLRFFHSIKVRDENMIHQRESLAFSGWDFLILVTCDMWTKDIWFVDERYGICGRMIFDMWTNDIWHVGERYLIHGRKMYGMWTNDKRYVEWYLICGRKMFDMWVKDMWYVDEWYVICGRKMFDAKKIKSPQGF